MIFSANSGIFLQDTDALTSTLILMCTGTSQYIPKGEGAIQFRHENFRVFITKLKTNMRIILHIWGALNERTYRTNLFVVLMKF